MTTFGPSERAVPLSRLSRKAVTPAMMRMTTINAIIPLMANILRPDDSALAGWAGTGGDGFRAGTGGDGSEGGRDDGISRKVGFSFET